MSERIARLRAHQRNIDRYENLLKTNLTELERTPTRKAALF